MNAKVNFLSALLILGSLFESTVSSAFASNKRSLDEDTVARVAKKPRLSDLPGKEKDYSAYNDVTKIESPNAIEKAVSEILEGWGNLSQYLRTEYNNGGIEGRKRLSADFSALFKLIPPADLEDLSKTLRDMRNEDKDDTFFFFDEFSFTDFFLDLPDEEPDALSDILKNLSKAIKEEGNNAPPLCEETFFPAFRDLMSEEFSSPFLICDENPFFSLTPLPFETFESEKEKYTPLIETLKGRKDWLALASVLAFLQNISEEDLKAIEKIGGPFFEKISDCLSLFAVLNHLRTIPGEDNRQKHATALPHLLENMKRPVLLKTLFSLKNISAEDIESVSKAAAHIICVQNFERLSKVDEKIVYKVLSALTRTPSQERDSVAKAVANLLPRATAYYGKTFFHLDEGMATVRKLFAALLTVPAYDRDSISKSLGPLMRNDKGERPYLKLGKQPISIYDFISGLQKIEPQNREFKTKIAAAKADYIEFLLPIDVNEGCSDPREIKKTVELAYLTRDFKDSNHYQYEAVGSVQTVFDKGSGTLITPNLVLTSAHVIYDAIKPYVDISKLDPTQGPTLFLLNGSVTFESLKNGFLRSHPASMVMIDTEYLIHKDIASDIALLVLQNPIVDLKPIPCMNQLRSIPKFGLFAGYGARSKCSGYDGFKHVFLQKMKGEKIHDDTHGRFKQFTCRDQFLTGAMIAEKTNKNPKEQTNLLKLAGGVSENLNQFIVTVTVPGDSGGPLIVYNPDTDALCIVGICKGGYRDTTKYAFLGERQEDGVYLLNKGFRRMLEVAELY